MGAKFSYPDPEHGASDRCNILEALTCHDWMLWRVGTQGKIHLQKTP